MARAEAVLKTLERGEQRGALIRLAEDLPLFSAARAASPAPPTERSALLAALAELRPDELSPRDALDLLYRLKALAEDDRTQGE